MELTGRAIGVSRDWNTDKLNITLEINEESVLKHGYDKIKDAEKLNIKISKYRQKRSLDANAYFHVLVGKIADALHPPISKAKCKNILICKYGQPFLLDDGSPMIYKTNAPVSFMEEQETLHCIPVKYEDDATFYKVYRGSHEYDTKEMSVLIDGTVADAQELGIDTVSPEEIRKMKERWNV